MIYENLRMECGVSNSLVFMGRGKASCCNNHLGLLWIVLTPSIWASPGPSMGVTWPLISEAHTDNTNIVLGPDNDNTPDLNEVRTEDWLSFPLLSSPEPEPGADTSHPAPRHLEHSSDNGQWLGWSEARETPDYAGWSIKSNCIKACRN